LPLTKSYFSTARGFFGLVKIDLKLTNDLHTPWNRRGRRRHRHRRVYRRGHCDGNFDRNGEIASELNLFSRFYENQNFKPDKGGIKGKFHITVKRGGRFFRFFFSRRSKMRQSEPFLFPELATPAAGPLPTGISGRQ
jgi:hypothetical protein